MYQGMDIRGIDEQPRENASPAAALFFIIFIFAGAIFIFQLFISVIISVYDDNMGSASLTDDQSQCQTLQRLLEFYAPDWIPEEPSNRVRRIAYNITTGESQSSNYAVYKCGRVSNTCFRICEMN